MKDLLQALLFGLIPPQIPLTENGPPSKQATMEYRMAKLRWYRAVATALWVLILSLTLFIVWSTGMLPRTTGLAYAEDFKASTSEVSQKITSVEDAIAMLALDQLEARLMNNRRLQCEAIEADDAARKKTYAEIMQDLKLRYLKTEGRNWDQPECDAL